MQTKVRENDSVWCITLRMVHNKDVYRTVPNTLLNFKALLSFDLAGSLVKLWLHLVDVYYPVKQCEILTQTGVIFLYVIFEPYLWILPSSSAITLSLDKLNNTVPGISVRWQHVLQFKSWHKISTKYIMIFSPNFHFLFNAYLSSFVTLLVFN